MLRSIITYSLPEVTDYINWLYFFHAWGFPPRYAAVAHISDCGACITTWLASFSENERVKAEEALQLYKETVQLLNQSRGEMLIRSVYRLCPAFAEGDNLWVDGTCIPLLRQQTTQEKEGIFLCLSDFVRPLSSETTDTVGIFASSVEWKKRKQGEDDPYRQLLVQTLADRLAEAATEKMHEYVRKVAWGYAPDENLSISDLLQEKFQGIRPAVGYPSLPDQSINFLLDTLLEMKEIGITLTEHGAMQPHASVSGFMLAHPAARYFNVGPIGEDQLEDYARRRQLPVTVLRKFLAANLSS